MMRTQMFILLFAPFLFSVLLSKNYEWLLIFKFKFYKTWEAFILLSTFVMKCVRLLIGGDSSAVKIVTGNINTWSVNQTYS